MAYKVSKDYPRLKQLLDSGHWVVCWVTYDWSRGDGHMVTDIAQARRKGKGEYLQYTVSVRGCEFSGIFPSIYNDFKDEDLYRFWGYDNLQFLDPDYERNTLELEDVSYKEFGGK